MSGFTDCGRASGMQLQQQYAAAACVYCKGPTACSAGHQQLAICQRYRQSMHGSSLHTFFANKVEGKKPLDAT